LELGDVAVQSLVPAPLQNVASADDFMQQLPQYDADLAQQVSEADAAGECLRFVGKSCTCHFAVPTDAAVHCNVHSGLTWLISLVCASAWLLKLVLCCAVLCCAVLCCAVLFHMTPFPTPPLWYPGAH